MNEIFSKEASKKMEETIEAEAKAAKELAESLKVDWVHLEGFSTFKEKYYAYLASPEWQEKRQERLEFDQHVCGYCGGHGKIIHHLNYDTVFRETLHDLITVCEVCHAIKHYGIWE